MTRRRDTTPGPDPEQEMLNAVVPALKTHGVNVPVDRLMSSAGLTSGALYSHFKNKEDLCNRAISVALDQLVAWWRQALEKHGENGLQVIVDDYLNEAHLVGVADGCPLAALGSDMAKASATAKRAFETRTQVLLGLIADNLAFGTPTARRVRAQYILSTMLGAVTLARTMHDPIAINDLLAHVRSSLQSELRRSS